MRTRWPEEEVYNVYFDSARNRIQSDSLVEGVLRILSSETVGQLYEDEYNNPDWGEVAYVFDSDTLVEFPAIKRKVYDVGWGVDGKWFVFYIDNRNFSHVIPCKDKESAYTVAKDVTGWVMPDDGD